jgi:hypothetical protein
MIAEVKIFRYHISMAKRNYLRLGCFLAAILLLFQVLNSSLRSQTIAQEAFRNHCVETHGDYSSYKMVYGKVEPFGHYYDFSVTIPGTYPGEMGFYRVYVTWIGTSSVGGFQGRPF